jgi:hypothetical protein
MPNSSKPDFATLRRAAPLASAIYFAVFVLVFAIFLAAVAADFRLDHNSVPVPTATKTAAYPSHGKTLYVEPEIIL